MPRPTRAFGRLAGKAVIVTGAGSQTTGGDVGIGAAIALLFSAEGARVGCADIDAARAGRTRDAILKGGGEAIAICADVSSQAGCADIVAAALGAFGRIDSVINN